MTRVEEATLADGQRAEQPAISPDSQTFFEIFQNEYSYVLSSLRRLGTHEADLEDVTHEVFLVVHRRLDSYDRSRALRPWLFGIALRAASDFRRLARHRREVIHQDIEAPDAARPLDDQVFAQQARHMVQRALESLDLDRRAVFVMADIDGLPVPEIATALAIPLNTAYSRLRLARAQFTTTIQKMQRGER
jgi:RNA polymerase sigma-70 factor, ECF subfamily